MELPFNTTISSDLLKGAGRFTQPVANWPTKRRWVQEAFEALERAGYHVGSAYTATKDPSRSRFVYRDRLWQGADMVGLGVASFGHVNGVHVQNVDTWETYSAAILGGEIPLSRAYRPTDEERMIRELVLQLKLGSVRPAYFRDKYHVDILDRFREPARFAGRRGLSRSGDRRHRRADAGGPAARRHAAAAVFPTRAPGHPLHLVAMSAYSHPAGFNGRERALGVGEATDSLSARRALRAGRHRGARS